MNDGRAIQTSDRLDDREIKPGTAATVGTFDGVHSGHRALIARTIEVATARSLDPVALTWDRHPKATLRPGSEPKLITSLERKVELLREQGLERVVVLPFDEELSRRSPEEFVANELAAGLGARAVVMGKGWRFGRGARGDESLLRAVGAELGFSVEALSLAHRVGGPVSSSRIRAVLEGGDMELVRELLCRPFDLDGRVVVGARRGADLGFPTANLEVRDDLARPALGIYAGRALVAGTPFPAAISIGVVPQFGGRVGASPVKIEAHLIDFEGELYGETIRLELHLRLREERAFGSVEELVEQMTRDVEAARSATS